MVGPHVVADLVDVREVVDTVHVHDGVAEDLEPRVRACHHVSCGWRSTRGCMEREKEAYKYRVENNCVRGFLLSSPPDGFGI